MRLRHCRLVLLLVIAAAARAAEEYEYFHYVGPQFRLSLPADMVGDGVPPFHRVVTGHLLQLGYPDSVLLAGDEPVLCVASGYYGAYLRYNIAATDLALLPGGGSHGADAVVAVGAQGVWRLGADPLGSWATPIHAPAWADVRLVRAADLDAKGHCDLIGVADSGLVIRILKNDGSTFTDGGFISSSSVIRDVVAFAWSGGGPRSLAVLTDAGVDLCDPAPGAVAYAHFPALAAGGALTLFRQQNRERLAWINPSSTPGGQQLCIIDQASLAVPPVWEPALPLGTPDVASCVAADIDGDGDDDLMITHRVAWDPVILCNLNGLQGGAHPATFTNLPPWAFFVETDVAGAAASNDAIPVLTDLDGDGDPDIVLPIQGDGRVMVMANEMTPLSATRVTLDSVEVNGTNQHDGLYDREAQVNLLLPDLPSATHLQAVLWRQATATATVDPAAVGSRLFELPLESIAVDLGEGLVPSDEVFSLELRMVVLDARGVLSQSYPPLMIVFSTKTDYFDDQSLAYSPVTWSVDDKKDGLPQKPGGVTSLPQVQPFPSGNTPPSNGTPPH